MGPSANTRTLYIARNVIAAMAGSLSAGSERSMSKRPRVARIATLAAAKPPIAVVKVAAFSSLLMRNTM
jgi:hypothetical protein